MLVSFGKFGFDPDDIICCDAIKRIRINRDRRIIILEFGVRVEDRIISRELEKDEVEPFLRIIKIFINSVKNGNVFYTDEHKCALDSFMGFEDVVD